MPKPVDSQRGEIAIPFVVRNDGLLVPPWYATPFDTQKPPFLQFSITTAGWRDIVPNGEPPTLDAVIARLARYSLRQICFMISRISIVLQSRPRASIRTIQDEIVDSHLGAGTSARLRWNIAQRLGDEYDSERVAFFHERQMLNALKLAFLTIQLDVPDTQASLIPFVEALLMLTDLIDEPHEKRAIATEQGRAATELHMFANVLFNQSAGGLNDFVRAHDLFIKPDRSIIDAPGAANIPELLEHVTGFAPGRAWALLYALATGWLTKSTEDLAEGRLAQNKSTYLSTLGRLSVADVERAFAMACWEAGDLQSAIRRRYEHGRVSIEALRSYDFLPFEKRPLVAFGESVTCVSIPLLLRLTTSSLQHRFLDTDIFAEDQREAFLRTRGRLFERYALDALVRTFGPRFYPEANLLPFAADAKVCDGLVVYDNALILIEAKAAMVPLDTRNTESYGRYRDTVRRTTREAADQLESTANLVAIGAFRSLGIDPACIRQVYPVVALLEQIVTPLTYRSILDKDLAGHPLLTRMAAGRAAPIQLLHVTEVELWEIAAESGCDIRDLLRTKVSDQEMQEMSFNHFCHHRKEPFLNRRGEWYARRFGEITAEIRRELVTLGLTLREEA